MDGVTYQRLISGENRFSLSWQPKVGFCKFPPLCQWMLSLYSSCLGDHSGETSWFDFPVTQKLLSSHTHPGPHSDRLSLLLGFPWASGRGAALRMHRLQLDTLHSLVFFLHLTACCLLHKEVSRSTKMFLMNKCRFSSIVWHPCVALPCTHFSYKPILSKLPETGWVG